MPEELGEGLYLAGVGMGLVFLTLLAFLLILLALRRVFPGGEATPASQESQAPAETGEEDAPTEATQPQALADGGPSARAPGEKIAAAAVATYLALEQEEQPGQAPGTTPAPSPPRNASAWVAQGRASLLGSHGRRPPPYGQKPRSTYPREGLSR